MSAVERGPLAEQVVERVALALSRAELDGLNAQAEAAIRELIREVLVWRSPDTAPRDGTSVLVAADRGIYGRPSLWIGSWWGGAAWFTDAGTVGHEAVVGWMPLPKPPKVSTKERTT